MPLPFDFSSTHYSPANLRALLEAAILSYTTDANILEGKLRDAFGTRKFIPFASNHDKLLGVIPTAKIQDTQGYIAADPEKIILAFRGTEGPQQFDAFVRDWASDAFIQQSDFQRYFPTAPGIGKVHAGFGKALRDVWQQQKIAQKVLSVRKQYPNASLWITGHSLGGALAVLASACCYYETQNQTPVAGCYTFGQPRVGDLIFRSFYESALGTRTYFVVNNGDIVTRIPPRHIDCVPGMNYATLGRLVFLDQGSATNDAIAWHRFTQSHPVGWKGISRINSSVSEHFTDSYRQAVASATQDLSNLTW